MARSVLSTKEKLAVARYRAAELMPYMHAGLFSLMPIEVPHGTLNTFGVTDRGHLLWDPAAVERWDIAEIAGVLLHELMHVIGKHGERCLRLAANPQLWNIAADCEINDDLRAASVKLPAGGLYPDTFGMADGLIAETYYRELQQKIEEMAVKEQLGKDAADGFGGQCGSGAGNPLDCEPKGGKGSGKGEDGADGEGKGSGSGMTDAVTGLATALAEGRSEAELEGMRRVVAEAVNEEAAKGRGTVPAGMKRWAEEYLSPPKIDWRDHLARSCRRAVTFVSGMVDYSYHRPARRQGAFGYGTRVPIMPTMRRPVPRVAIGVDTSGSMGADELETAVTESAGVLKAVGASVDFLACDSQVGASRTVKSVHELRDALIGGGGTDFDPIFDAVDRLPKGRPDILIIITDGCAPAPTNQPLDLQVIWVLVGPHRQKPWGDARGIFIEVDDDLAKEVA